MKLVYFAWVRERIGKAEEEVDRRPASIRSPTGEVAAGPGEEYAHAFENPAWSAPPSTACSQARGRIAGAREIAFFPPMTGGNRDRPRGHTPPGPHAGPRASRKARRFVRIMSR